MKIDELKVEPRNAEGSSSARRLRASGKVPAILYGHRETPVNLAIDTEALDQMLSTGHQLVTLNVQGKQERALLKEVQYDTWGREVLHVDFSRVGLDELVTVEVPVVSHGTPKAILSGAVLEQPLHELEIECKADAIPDQILVEVGGLELDQKIHVKDLALPEGVRAKNEAEAIVFVVKIPRGPEEVPTAAAAEAPAEPELIKRPAKETEEGEAAGKS